MLSQHSRPPPRCAISPLIILFYVTLASFLHLEFKRQNLYRFWLSLHCFPIYYYAISTLPARTGQILPQRRPPSRTAPRKRTPYTFPLKSSQTKPPSATRSLHHTPARAHIQLGTLQNKISNHSQFFITPVTINNLNKHLPRTILNLSAPNILDKKLYNLLHLDQNQLQLYAIPPTETTISTTLNIHFFTLNGLNIYFSTATFLKPDNLAHHNLTSSLLLYPKPSPMLIYTLDVFKSILKTKLYLLQPSPTHVICISNPNSNNLLFLQLSTTLVTVNNLNKYSPSTTLNLSAPNILAKKLHKLLHLDQNQLQLYATPPPKTTTPKPLNTCLFTLTGLSFYVSTATFLKPDNLVFYNLTPSLLLYPKPSPTLIYILVVFKPILKTKSHLLQPSPTHVICISNTNLHNLLSLHLRWITHYHLLIFNLGKYLISSFSTTPNLQIEQPAQINIIQTHATHTHIILYLEPIQLNSILIFRHNMVDRYNIPPIYTYTYDHTTKQILLKQI